MLVKATVTDGIQQANGTLIGPNLSTSSYAAARMEDAHLPRGDIAAPRALSVLVPASTPWYAHPLLDAVLPNLWTLPGRRARLLTDPVSWL